MQQTIPSPEAPAGSGRRFDPRSPISAGTEPDYRFSLANERTFLAWIRTAIALLAGGVAVVQLVPDLAPRPQRLGLGVAFALLAFTVAATSYRRWWLVQRAMRTGAPLPHTWLPAVIAAGLTIIITLTVVLMLGN
jgi:putative membrane protein